jgi:hypothetical protein
MHTDQLHVMMSCAPPAPPPPFSPLCLVCLSICGGSLHSFANACAWGV